MGYKVINQEEYYRNYVYGRFTKEVTCSMAMTAKVDMTELISYSKKTNTNFYIALQKK